MKAAIPLDEQKFDQVPNSSSGRKAIAADLIKAESRKETRVSEAERASNLFFRSLFQARQRLAATPDWAESRSPGSETRRDRAFGYAGRVCGRAREHRHHPADDPAERVAGEISIRLAKGRELVATRNYCRNSAHKRDARPDRPKLVKNCFCANIAKMPDLISVLRHFLDARWQAIVRIGENEDAPDIFGFFMHCDSVF